MRQVARFQDSHIMYNPTIFNSQPNTKIKFFDDRSKRQTEEEDSEEDKGDKKDGEQGTYKWIEMCFEK